MKIYNLTPHIIHLPGMSLEPCKMVSRCTEKTIRVGEFLGIELITREYGDVTDLPEPAEGTLYIVSMLVRQALPHRQDIASPGDLIRDTNGQIIGAKNLVVNIFPSAQDVVK
jgi:hypothetical protein